MNLPFGSATHPSLPPLCCDLSSKRKHLILIGNERCSLATNLFTHQAERFCCNELWSIYYLIAPKSLTPIRDTSLPLSREIEDYFTCGIKSDLYFNKWNCSFDCIASRDFNGNFIASCLGLDFINNHSTDIELVYLFIIYTDSVSGCRMSLRIVFP